MKYGEILFTIIVVLVILDLELMSNLVIDVKIFFLILKCMGWSSWICTVLTVFAIKLFFS